MIEVDLLLFILRVKASIVDRISLVLDNHHNSIIFPHPQSTKGYISIIRMFDDIYYYIGYLLIEQRLDQND